jgi:hypothetical protein
MSLTIPACLNVVPPATGESAVDNHAPSIEIFPPPGPVPFQIPNGAGCLGSVERLGVTALDDADGNTLTARFDIVFLIDGELVRDELRQSPPIPVLDNGTYAAGDVTSIPFNRNFFAQRIDLNRQEGLTQLVELRVTDGAFERNADGNVSVTAGSAEVFFSWPVTVVPPPLEGCRP